MKAPKTIVAKGRKYRLHKVVKSYSRSDERKKLINKGYDVKVRLASRGRRTGPSVGWTFDQYAIYKRRVRGACPRDHHWSPKYKTCINDRVNSDAYAMRQYWIKRGIKPKRL